jgi:protein required for attachment to host cells
MMSGTSSKDRFYWVIVADESKAVVYARDSRSGPMYEVSSFENDVARMKAGELISDSGGRSFDSMGKGRHTMTNEKVDARKHAAQLFAKEIAGRIAGVMHDGSCRGFALVAAPRFLGILRDSISVATTAQPYATVDKDVVGKDTATIEKLLVDA